MSILNGNETKNGKGILDMISARDMFMVLALGSMLTGGSLFSGTQTRDAITDQTVALTKRLDAMRSELADLNYLAGTNRESIDANTKNYHRLEGRMDTMYQTLMDGLQNLDGYFRDSTKQ